MVALVEQVVTSSVVGRAGRQVCRAGGHGGRAGEHVGRDGGHGGRAGGRRGQAGGYVSRAGDHGRRRWSSRQTGRRSRRSLRPGSWSRRPSRRSQLRSTRSLRRSRWSRSAKQVVATLGQVVTSSVVGRAAWGGQVGRAGGQGGQGGGAGGHGGGAGGHVRRRRPSRQTGRLNTRTRRPGGWSCRQSRRSHRLSR